MCAVKAEVGEREGFRAVLGCDVLNPVETGIVAGISKLLGGALDAVIGQGAAAEVGFDCLKIRQCSWCRETVGDGECAIDIAEIGAAQRFEVGANS